MKLNFNPLNLELKCNGCEYDVTTLEIVKCTDSYVCEAEVQSCETIVSKGKTRTYL